MVEEVVEEGHILMQEVGGHPAAAEVSSQVRGVGIFDKRWVKVEGGRGSEKLREGDKITVN